jgi:hypothetical protein
MNQSNPKQPSTKGFNYEAYPLPNKADYSSSSKLFQPPKAESYIQGQSRKGRDSRDKCLDGPYNVSEKFSLRTEHIYYVE